MSTRSHLALTICLALHPALVLGWGSHLHGDINRGAALYVPDEMAGWRAYANVLAAHGSDPDYWKETDRAERPRHYIDLELYGDPSSLALPRNHAKLPPLVKKELSLQRGVLPWVAMAVQERLTQSMRDGNWSEAARLAAALGHYVADSHQPLHCTENHDGQFTGNDGIHMRWEIELVLPDM